MHFIKGELYMDIQTTAITISRIRKSPGFFLQRLPIRLTVAQRIEPQIVVYLLMVLGLGIPDDTGCRGQIPVCGSVSPLDATMPGCRAPIPSKGKQRFGALSSVERSIELTTAVRINELEDRRSERISQGIDGGKGTLTALSMTPINPKIWS